MNKIFTLASFLVMHFSSGIGHTSDRFEDSDATADDNCVPYEDCIREIVSKVYVNPDRVFCEGDSYFLALAKNKYLPISQLEQDAQGYFFEMPTNDLVHSMRDNSFQNSFVWSATSRCPLCERPGYVAGRCKNPDCPGNENKRKYDEDRKKKKEDYAKKKKGK